MLPGIQTEVPQYGKPSWKVVDWTPTFIWTRRGSCQPVNAQKGEKQIWGPVVYDMQVCLGACASLTGALMSNSWIALPALCVQSIVGHDSEYATDKPEYVWN